MRGEREPPPAVDIDERIAPRGCAPGWFLELAIHAQRRLGSVTNHPTRRERQLLEICGRERLTLRCRGNQRDEPKQGGADQGRHERSLHRRHCRNVNNPGQDRDRQSLYVARWISWLSFDEDGESQAIRWVEGVAECEVAFCLPPAPSMDGCVAAQHECARFPSVPDRPLQHSLRFRINGLRTVANALSQNCDRSPNVLRSLTAILPSWIAHVAPCAHRCDQSRRHHEQRSVRPFWLNDAEPPRVYRRRRYWQPRAERPAPRTGCRQPLASQESLTGETLGQAGAIG